MMTTARNCKQKNCNRLLGTQRARECAGGFGCTSLDLPKLRAEVRCTMCWACKRSEKKAFGFLHN